MDILTKMHYQDFNNAGNPKQMFNPMDLVVPNQQSDDEMMSPTNFSNTEEDEIEVDDFTKKRLPKVEDFIVERKEKPKKKIRPKG